MTKLNNGIGVAMLIFFSLSVSSLISYYPIEPNWFRFNWGYMADTGVPLVLGICILLFCLFKSSSDRRLYLLGAAVPLLWAAYLGSVALFHPNHAYLTQLDYGQGAVLALYLLIFAFSFVLSLIGYTKGNQASPNTYVFWVMLGYTALFLGMLLDNARILYSVPLDISLRNTFAVLYLLATAVWSFRRVYRDGDLSRVLRQGNYSLLFVALGWAAVIWFGPSSDSWNLGNGLLLFMMPPLLFALALILSVGSWIASTLRAKKIGNSVAPQEVGG